MKTGTFTKKVLKEHLDLEGRMRLSSLLKMAERALYNLKKELCMLKDLHLSPSEVLLKVWGTIQKGQEVGVKMEISQPDYTYLRFRAVLYSEGRICAEITWEKVYLISQQGTIQEVPEWIRKILGDMPKKKKAA